MKQKNPIFHMILSALFLAMAYVLPFFTGQIPQIGAMLCPMHIPVLLCGFVCGWPWGMAVGLIAPLFRSVTLGMPPLFPTALCMAFELATYGAVAGWMRKILPKKKGWGSVVALYASLLVAMLGGRLVWGAAMYVCLGMQGGSFGFSAFLAGAVTNALPGIMVQLVLVPALVMVLEQVKRGKQ